MPVNTAIQQITILRHLIKTPKTTIEFKDMNIIDPTARIAELRACGFYIVTVDQEYTDSYGEKHIIGRYVLLSQYNDLNNKGESLLERVYSI